MADKARYQNRIEFLQGTLEMLILRTLQWGAQHGHGIGQAIRLHSGELLQVETGSLYPALHRLQKQGWLQSEWKVSENKQRAKYYRLTAAGKKQLLAEQSKWELFESHRGRDEACAVRREHVACAMEGPAEVGFSQE